MSMDTTTSRTDKVITSYIRARMESDGVTQADIGDAIGGRSKGYVSDRILAKRSWAISELDRIAPLFGLPDALALVAAATGYMRDAPLSDSEVFELAANTDENRDMEAGTPRD